MSNFILNAYVRSDVGKLRNNNEDNYRLLDVYHQNVDENNSEAFGKYNDQMALFSVCDGMGGEECGEVASLIAVENMKPAANSSFKETANEDTIAINTMVCEKAKEKGIARMGSTLANLYIDEGVALAANVGDSRVYFFREGKLTRLTIDHDEASRLVSMGLITEEQALTDKRKHQLTQYLGMDDDDIVPEPHFSEEIKISAGDRFLLVSDGVTDLLSDDDITEILKKGLAPKEIVNIIVDMALERRGHDNTTALLVDVEKRRKSVWEKLKGFIHGN